MNLEELMNKNFDEFFWSIYDYKVNNLRNNNEEFKSLNDKILAIEDVESLHDLFLKNEAKSLSEDETKYLLEYMQLQEEKHIIEIKETFYTGIAISKFINKKLDSILSDLDN